MYALIDESGNRRDLTGNGPWLIGRHVSADIRFDDPYCPRKALQLERVGNRLMLTPLSESSPILLDGRAASDAVEVRVGSLLSFGQTRVRLSLAQDGEDRTTALIGHAMANGGGSRNRGGPALMRPGSVIGRDPGEGGYVLDDPTVSRRHAELRQGRNGVDLIDLGSTNGTFVNGQRIAGEQMLREGDQIVIGQSRFVFERGTLVMPRMKPDRPLVVAQDVTVDVSTVSGQRRILQPSSVTIREGEVVCIIGGSGAGKTTLMNAIAGRSPLSGGQVDIDGTDLTTEFNALKQLMAYVPQREILHERLTLRKALGYVAELRLPLDTRPEERRSAIDEAVARVEMSDFLDIEFRKLSGGQKKRACLAAEILCKPRILFLDEVTSGLDEQTEFEIMRLMANLAKDGMTIICVTHALANIQAFCNQLVVMAPGGHLVFQGTPDDALHHFRVDRLGKVIALLTPETSEGWAKRYVAEPRRDSDYTMSQGVTSLSRRKQRSFLTAFAQKVDQTGVLMRRNLSLLLADGPTLTLALVQAVVIGFFVGWAFSDFGEGFQIVESKKILITLCVMSAMWIGASGASKDIVAEAVIVQRERDVNLSLTAYLISRIAMGSAFVTVQLAFVHLLLLLLSDGIPGNIFAQFFIINMAGYLAVTIGLLVSASAVSESQATAIVPLVLVPQLITIGSIVPNPPKLLADFGAIAVPTNVLREAMTAVFVRSGEVIETINAATGRPIALTAKPLNDSLSLLAIHYLVIVSATAVVLWYRYRSGAKR